MSLDSRVGVRMMASIALPPGHRETGLLIVARGFFDESFQGKDCFEDTIDHRDTRIAAIAGYISSIKRWDKFEKQWNREVIEASARIGPSKINAFHMTDCESQHGEFEGWTPDQCLSLKKIALPIIPHRTLFGAGAAVVIKDYEELTCGATENGHPYLRDPYFFCFFLVLEVLIRRASQWLSESEKIALFFDEKEKVVGRAKQYFDWHKRDKDKDKKLISLKYASDLDMVPIQAADILAYETAKHLLNRLYDPNRAIRVSLRVLSAKNSLTGGYHDRETLGPIIERMKRDGQF
jgi:hypothetical protein